MCISGPAAPSPAVSSANRNLTPSVAMGTSVSGGIGLIDLVRDSHGQLEKTHRILPRRGVYEMDTRGLLFSRYPRLQTCLAFACLSRFFFCAAAALATFCLCVSNSQFSRCIQD